MTRDRRTGRPVDAHGDPLMFAVAGLLAEPPGTVREYDFDGVEVTPPDGSRVVEPVAGRVRLLRTNRGLVVDARLHTALAGECARCLTPVVTKVELRIDEEVLPSVDLGSGLPVPPEEDGDPEVARLTDHHELELRPLIEQAIAMEDPIAVRCAPDCPGLCLVCGVRLEPGHAHDDAPIDPRLEALRAFRVDGSGENG